MNSWWLIALLLLSGCTSPCLRVQTFCVRPGDLASYRVGTPDPRQICPDVGQKLVLRWALDPTLGEEVPPVLILGVRYGNGEEEWIQEPIRTFRGRFTRALLNDEYFQKRGFQAFKAEIRIGHHTVACWRHHLWEDRLEF